MSVQPPTIRDALSQRGIRCTRQREVIYSTLMATTAHPTADELFQAVRTSQPGISLATVYNTLESFTRLGLCRRLPPATAGAGGAACRYDGNVDCHVHLVDSSGAIRDLPDDLGQRLLAAIPPDLVHEIEERLDTTVERISVDLFAGREAANSGHPAELS